MSTRTNGSKNLLLNTFGKSSSGSEWTDIPIVAPAGSYVLSFQTLTSTDTDVSTCKVVFYNSSNQAVSSNLMFSRGSNVYKDVTLTGVSAYVRVYCADTVSHGTGDTVTYSGAMLCSSTDWAISDSYVVPKPYVDALVGLIDSGAKNVLNTRAMQTQTASGTTCTCTVNSDFSMTLTGKNTGSSAVFFSIPVSFPKGDYYFTGMPGTGSSSTYRMELRTNSTMGNVYKTVESNLPVDISRDSDWSGYFNIRVASNYDFGSTGVTVKPMICSKIAWLISNTYVPYIPSMAQMYDMIQAIQNGT